MWRQLLCYTQYIWSFTLTCLPLILHNGSLKDICKLHTRKRVVPQAIFPPKAAERWLCKYKLVPTTAFPSALNATMVLLLWMQCKNLVVSLQCKNLLVSWQRPHHAHSISFQELDWEYAVEKQAGWTASSLSHPHPLTQGLPFKNWEQAVSGLAKIVMLSKRPCGSPSIWPYCIKSIVPHSLLPPCKPPQVAVGPWNSFLTLPAVEKL